MNDSRLTAYALGELDAPERENFEKDLAASAELQAELKDIVALAEQIPGALASDASLTDAQRDSLRTRFAENHCTAAAQKTTRRLMAGAGIGALAAGLVAAALVVTRPTEPTAPSLAQAPATASSQPVDEASHAKVAQLLADAKKFSDQGSYNLAGKRYEQTLALDSSNVAAREGLAAVDRARSASQATTYNETRSTLVAEVSQGMELPVRHFSEGSGSLAAAQPAQPKSESVAAPPGAVTATSTRTGGAIGGVQSDKVDSLRAALATGYAGETRNLAKDIDLPPGESYAETAGNSFLATQDQPLSTFSIDVDTASYANIRRFLTNGSLPPAAAVRVEELVNYFPYTDPLPDGDAPFSVNVEVAKAPWNQDHLLARVALKGRDLAPDKLPPSNLVFLVDVSGSMQPENKLPLLKRSLLALVDKLSPQDRVAIVTYAGNSGVALDSTEGREKSRIRSAIEKLHSGGSTNGASGIQLAYEIAREHFRKDGNNRIILCTDGDFNVGVTSHDELTRLIERERKSGVFLSVLGFGTGNLKDATMENLADKGNGNYAYIDTPAEGRKVLVDQMRANLFTIAKDVKIQVEFNPATVAGYRLVGYENRLLAKEDFNNDKKDAGEIGAGHSVTAFYEIVPAGQPLPNSVDPLKYQATENRESRIENTSRDLFTVKLRYKAPDGDRSQLITKEVGPAGVALDKASEDFRFGAAVAAFGMKLRGDANDASLPWSGIQSLARSALGEDPDAYRAEFLTLVQKAKQLAPDVGE